MSSDLSISAGPAMVEDQEGQNNSPSNKDFKDNSIPDPEQPVSQSSQTIAQTTEHPVTQSSEPPETHLSKQTIPPSFEKSVTKVSEELVLQSSEPSVNQLSEQENLESSEKILQTCDQPIIQIDEQSPHQHIFPISQPLKHDLQNGEASPTTSPTETTKEKEQEEIKENGDIKKEEAEILDVQVLTEQIMNLLNEGKSESLMTQQELFKKNVELQEFILKLIQVLKEKTNLCANLERQNIALIGQAQSLKDVIAITKDLLGIRNMEVEHLHADMSSMETRIKEERARHNTSVARLNEAMKLNDKLKTEYLVQMDLFQKLRDKYNEKVLILTKENQRLLEVVKNNGLEKVVNQESQETAVAESGGPIPVERHEENVDK